MLKWGGICLICLVCSKYKNFKKSWMAYLTIMNIFLTLGTDSMQQLVDKVLSELIHLKTFYIFVCPAQKLSIKSKSLEKLCIYKSEHVELHSLDLPNLKILMLHGDLIELVYKAHQVLDCF